eukprot:CAMPEP_0204481386 /NCGR_PEP_ID=MMETSP0471-20130131/47081_1 /ASSEMBLY_ACC=CAM_ASM_000602 /TAXON_ID=2969 /ORGANISM="Oxyrrhis marina" /LENGTH=96 /DNA_ID=CAMNT_0051484539 /DNA_START=15 /DNA_END=305 /DNA_ORIENTATION=-
MPVLAAEIVIVQPAPHHKHIRDTEAHKVPGEHPALLPLLEQAYRPDARRPVLLQINAELCEGLPGVDNVFNDHHMLAPELFELRHACDGQVSALRT